VRAEGFPSDSAQPVQRGKRDEGQASPRGSRGAASRPRGGRSQPVIQEVQDLAGHSNVGPILFTRQGPDAYVVASPDPVAINAVLALAGLTVGRNFVDGLGDRLGYPPIPTAAAAHGRHKSRQPDRSGAPSRSFPLARPFQPCNRPSICCPTQWARTSANSAGRAALTCLAVDLAFDAR
jgi:hypothetical protein